MIGDAVNLAGRLGDHDEIALPHGILRPETKKSD
jgi:hypothetical protein